MASRAIVRRHHHLTASPTGQIGALEAAQDSATGGLQLILSMFNRRYQRAWLKTPPQRRPENDAQLELNFCAEPWRPLVVLAKLAEVADRKKERPLTEEELAAEFERLFPCR